MIIPDTNLLVYAHNTADPNYGLAHDWWNELMEGSEQVGLPWVVTTGFARLMTSSRLLSRPLTPEAVFDSVQEWFQFPHISPINPGADHLTLFRQNLTAAGVGGNLVTDAHIAALAMEHQAEVHSNDADFSRFPGLRWRNPLR